MKFNKGDKPNEKQGRREALKRMAKIAMGITGVTLLPNKSLTEISPQNNDRESYYDYSKYSEYSKYGDSYSRYDKYASLSAYDRYADRYADAKEYSKYDRYREYSKDSSPNARRDYSKYSG